MELHLAAEPSDENVLEASDFLLSMNGVSQPDRIGEWDRKTRATRGYVDQPILFNEDDLLLSTPGNNFVAAISEYASWGFFDPAQLRRRYQSLR